MYFDVHLVKHFDLVNNIIQLAVVTDWFEFLPLGPIHAALTFLSVVRLRKLNIACLVAKDSIFEDLPGEMAHTRIRVGGSRVRFRIL